MKPSGFIDGEFTEWLNLFIQAAGALPFDSTPHAVRCQSCGAVLDGVAAGRGGVATQRFQPMVEDDDGIISFWSEPIGEPVLHRRKQFQWRCRDCKTTVRLVPQKLS